MQQRLDYERPLKASKPPFRRDFGRFVLLAWSLVPCAFVFLLFYGGDRSSLQELAFLLFSFSLLAAIGSTLLHWLLVVPILWARTRKTSSRR